MISDARSELADLLEKHTGEPAPPSAGDVDLFDDLGVEGDDAFEFMDDFAARFGVDMDGYRWYFHHGEEGHNFGALFFRPPYRRVRRIPITPDILLEAIRTKRWPLAYPEHEAPDVRWDIRVNQLFGAGFLALFALWLWKTFVR